MYIRWNFSTNSEKYISNFLLPLKDCRQKHSKKEQRSLENILHKLYEDVHEGNKYISLVKQHDNSYCKVVSKIISTKQLPKPNIYDSHFFSERYK